ncbi:MAG: hypothetical protein R2722_15520 [Tessaracoccus sp.]
MNVPEDMLGMLPPHLATAVAADGQTTMGDKNYFGRQFEQRLQPRRHHGSTTDPEPGEKPRPGSEFFKPLRQVIESIFDTFKDQLDLERHNARTPTGVLARIATRILSP